MYVVQFLGAVKKAVSNRKVQEFTVRKAAFDPVKDTFVANIYVDYDSLNPTDRLVNTLYLLITPVDIEDDKASRGESLMSLPENSHPRVAIKVDGVSGMFNLAIPNDNIPYDDFKAFVIAKY